MRSGRAGAGIRILRQDAWEMLVTFIISQRKISSHSGLRGNAVYRYGVPLLQPGGNVLYAFPTAQALAAAGEQALRDCALGYRARMFWLPPRQLQRERWTLPRWKPCPMPSCWKL